MLDFPKTDPKQWTNCPTVKLRLKCQEEEQQVVCEITKKSAREFGKLVADLINSDTYQTKLV